MGSSVTTESQDTRFTSHPKDGTLHRAITALGYWDIFFRPEERVPPTGPPTPLSAALVSHPGADQEASQQWYAGWYAAGMLTS